MTSAAKRNGSAGGQKKSSAKKKAIQDAIAFCRNNPHMFATKKDAARYCEEHYPPVKFSTYRRVLAGIKTLRKQLP